MEKAKQKENEKQKQREKKMSEKKSKKQGAKVKEEIVEEEEIETYDADKIETMLPENITADDVKKSSTNLDYVNKAREKLIKLWYDNRAEDWKFKNTDNGVDLYAKPTTDD